MDEPITPQAENQGYILESYKALKCFRCSWVWKSKQKEVLVCPKCKALAKDGKTFEILSEYIKRKKIIPSVKNIPKENKTFISGWFRNAS